MGNDSDNAVKNPLIVVFDRIYENLLYTEAEICCRLTYTSVNYKRPNKKIIEIDYREVNTDYTRLIMISEIRSLAEIYPRIMDDKNFKTIEENLEKYKMNQSWVIRLFHLDGTNKKALKTISENMGPLLTKIYLMKEELEDLGKNLYELPNQQPKALEILQALEKDTSNITDLATKMKCHIVDIDIWKNFRSTWLQLNENLKLMGLKDDYVRDSERLMNTINNRYPSSEKLSSTDMLLCNELMNEILDLMFVYNARN